MKITAIDCVKVFVPWQPSLQDAMRRWRAASGTTPEEEDAYVLVEAHTDVGIIGIGEGGRSVEQTKAQAERFLGKNPLEMDPLTHGRPWAHVLFDIIGQALECPVYRLLGGKHRDKVPVAYWSPYLPPAETAKHAEEGASRGFKVHKIKARPWDAAAQVKAIAAAAGPDYAIRIDPNQTFAHPSTVVRIDREVEGYNVECFEDPVDKTRLEWWALLRQKCRVPLALHSSNPMAILNAARHLAIDYVNVGGSPLGILRAAAVAEAAGCPVWLQTEGHCLDIQAAFDAHVGAAIPNATLPYDTLHFLREGHVVQNPLEPKDGFLPVPEGPGLGIRLDRKWVENYRVE